MVNGLSSYGHKIYATDISFTYKICKDKNITLLKENLLSKKKSNKIKNCDIFIHNAAITKSNKNEDKSLCNANINLTKKALILAKKLNCKKFFFVSSTAVYRKFSKHKYNERSKTFALDSYTKSKLIGERISKEFCSKNKIKFTILRIGNIYNGFEKIKWSRFNISQMQRWLNENKKNKILKTNNFNTLRDWTFVNDIPKALNSLIINDQHFKILNLVSPYCYKDIYIMNKISNKSRSKDFIQLQEKHTINNATYSIYINRIFFKKWTTFQKAINLIRNYENL